MFNALLIIVIVIILIKLLPIFKSFYKTKQIVNVIPGPPEQFLLGHLHILTASTETLFERTREFSNTYFPIYRLSSIHVNIVHFLDPQDIALILSSTKHLSKSRVYTFLYNWLGTGLLTSTGTKWHQRRKILTPSFHFTILQQFLEVFNNETAKLLDDLSKDVGKVIDVVPPVTNFTLQAIAETAMGFGSIDDGSKVKYKDAVYEIGRIFLKRLERPWLRPGSIYSWSGLARKEKQVVKVLHDFSNRIILERERNFLENYSKKKRKAMLDLLLSAKKEGADIDFEGIREEVDTFMFEGHDTTSMAISFLLLVLANLQDVQDKVLEEVLSIVGPAKIPTFEDIHNLKYTERVIKETLRLFPSVPLISRYAGEDFVTKTGYKIPQGTVMHLPIYDVHRNKEIYPDPLRFDPDRFLPENSQNRDPFAYIPFSAGPRNCIGQRFAILELKAVICGVVRKFKLEKVDDMYEIEFRSDLVLRPRTDVKVKILDRIL